MAAACRSQRLRAVAFDDLLGLCDAAARSWTQPGHPLADFIRRNRLGFLPLWLRRANLQTLARRSLRGRPEALDRFVRSGREAIPHDGPRPAAGPGRALGRRQRARARPAVAGASHALQERQRGEGLAQPAGHACLTCSPRWPRSPTPTPAARRFSGRTLTDAMAVVYADRQDAAAARRTLAPGRRPRRLGRPRGGGGDHQPAAALWHGRHCLRAETVVCDRRRRASGRPATPPAGRPRPSPPTPAPSTSRAATRRIRSSSSAAARSPRPSSPACWARPWKPSPAARRWKRSIRPPP